MYYPESSYKTDLGIRLINETMMFAVLSKIRDLASYSDDPDLYDKLEILPSEERDPEVIISYMNKYKADLCIGLAYDKFSRPAGMSVEDAYNLYVKTIEFLASKKLAVPSLEIEFVIGNALEEYGKLDKELDLKLFSQFDNYDFKEQKDKKVETWEEFEKYISDASKFIGGTKEEVETLTKAYIEYMDMVKQEMEEDYIESFPTDADFIQDCLGELFNPNLILERSFYDNDYLFLRDMPIEILKKSDLNKVFGIVSADDPELE